jgi:hypothetical protein
MYRCRTRCRHDQASTGIVILKQAESMNVSFSCIPPLFMFFTGQLTSSSSEGQPLSPAFERFLLIC